jgi:hypothetical protein
MKLADNPHNYVRTSTHNIPFVRIPPGEEHTYVVSQIVVSQGLSSESAMLIRTPKKALANMLLKS